MSKRIPSAAARNLLPALAAVAFLSAAAPAADPNTSSEPNVPSGKKPATVQTPAAPTNKPERPVRRTPASFTPQMPFSEAMDILRNCTTPPLNIVVLWKDVGDNAGVYRDTPIGIDGVPGLRVGQYLDLLVLSLSAGASAKIGYTVQEGVITIGTTGALPAPKKVTRVYDVSDLVAAPARYFPLLPFGGMGYGGPMRGPLGGYSPGASYMGGSNGPASVSGFVGGLYGNRGRRSAASRSR